MATVAFYGPTNEFASKVAVSIIAQDGAEPSALERWHATDLDIRRDAVVGKAITAFLENHHARSVVVSHGIIGCPHEEGTDYPAGGTCPHCPFWAGRDRWSGA